MSAQFGRWSFDGMPPPLDLLKRVDAILAPFGPDASHSCHLDGASILYRASHTTQESRRETGPHISSSGIVLTWDGRLDNRTEFIDRFGGTLSRDSTDASIVSAAYERAGTECFKSLLGDWALSVWNPRERSLLLAKDPIGTRHLYYSSENDQIAWSTVLDPLVLLRARPFAMDEEYIAGWFSFFPAAHLTPYVGIDAVPPSCFVRFERGRRTITKYWDFDPGRKIRYRTDREYEEHFRGAFEEAVRRRLRSDRPVLAELSGGMDSSSIVCMADRILARAGAETPRLDTVSYHNDFEPNWNERPYFAKVEEKRGRAGWHIDASAQEPFNVDQETVTFGATPAARLTGASRQLAACMASGGNRVLLSGIGGDEFTGGVPTPVPELMDLEARARFGALAHQLKVWALEKRKPWFHLFFEAARGFLAPSLVGLATELQPAVWLEPSFARRYLAALTGYPSRVRLFGPLPSFQEDMSALEVLRRQLSCSALSSAPPYEKRYPFLDRTLLEFICAIPREQLVRPGQRRSLMRRSLTGIVPEEILHRKRKAFVTRSPLVALSKQSANLIAMAQDMTSSRLGIVDGKKFGEALQNARQGQPVNIVQVMRTLWVESWLRTVTRKQIVIDAGPRTGLGSSPGEVLWSSSSLRKKFS